MIICGTGHRPNKLGGYSQEAFDKLVQLASTWIINNSPSIVISGMALGWDQALAQAAINCNVSLYAAVPFKNQEAAWPKESKIYYGKLIELASKIIIVSEGTYTPYKMQVRNEWMVDNCDKVLAIWDGTKGGTYNCIKYAEKLNKEIINLHQEYIKL